MSSEPFFKFIVWGVEPTEIIPRIVNTCAIDTILFIMYHMRRINIVVKNVIITENGIIEKVMRLLDHDKCDEARYYIAKQNRELRYRVDGALPGGKAIDLYSGIGNWIWMFQCLTGYKRKSVMKCDTCKKYVVTEKEVQAIYLTKIDEYLSEELNKKLHSTMEQKCEEDTQRIDIGDENIAVYPNPCTGHVRIEDNIVVLPKILAIYGIEFDRNKEMKFIPFTAMPRTLNFMGEAWVLTGIVTNDTTHFRALVPIKDTKWVVYDGQDKDKDYKYVDIDG